MDEEDASVDSFISMQKKSSTRTKMMIEKLRRTLRETEREAMEIRQETERLRRVTLETRSILEKKHPRLLKSSSSQNDEHFSSKRFSDIASLLQRIDSSNKKFSSSRSLQDLMLPHLRRGGAISTDESISSSASSTASSTSSPSVRESSVPQRAMDPVMRPVSSPSYEPKYRKKKDTQKQLNKMILSSTLRADQEVKSKKEDEEEPKEDILPVIHSQMTVSNKFDPDEIIVVSDNEPLYAEIPSLKDTDVPDLEAIKKENHIYEDDRVSPSKESLSSSRLDSDRNGANIPLYSSETDETTTPPQDYISKIPMTKKMSALDSSSAEDEGCRRPVSPPSSNFNSKFNLKRHKPLNESDAELKPEELDIVSGPEGEDLLNDDDFWN